ncbi:hypothetical protein SAMN02745674_02932 [Lysobacter spongiicola DSM 21749]|uniref:Uncharacterized protein n=1 Tax=Lysobacter spongiicola DSM 21749 TaxID=1122188 RepID=A0A1T4SKR4_9GAMM|nr:hypothetical protein SAMN02745674_02932 [Lysobacter spongiicola DSM 21749]
MQLTAVGFFWILVVVALCVLLTFAWAAVPVLSVVLAGGTSSLWFFGHTEWLVGAAALYLGLAGALLFRRGRRAPTQPSA